MLILSKDRKKLYNLDAINGLFVKKRDSEPGALICADISEEAWIIMGVYPTEKAALEELEKIATENGWKSLYEIGQE